jgi:hypothetical protein
MKNEQCPMSNDQGARSKAASRQIGKSASRQGGRAPGREGGRWTGFGRYDDGIAGEV